MYTSQPMSTRGLWSLPGIASLLLLAGATTGPASAATAASPGAARPSPAYSEGTVATQAALDRLCFGVGLIDGKIGHKTQWALRDARATAGPDGPLASPEETRQAYTVTTGDWQEVGIAPEGWEERAAAGRMAFTSLLEALSEKFHASQNLLTRLNPEVQAWDETVVGRTIVVPAVTRPRRMPPAARVEIDTRQFRLRAFDHEGRVVASFPCSVARDRAKVPGGTLRIAAFAPNPVYVFDPANFPESPEAQTVGRKLIIPPGPNNPVGVYWLSLSRPGYGLHGTPRPETIGSAESHGCFRLTNWDIVTLAAIVTNGTPVRLVP